MNIAGTGEDSSSGAQPPEHSVPSAALPIEEIAPAAETDDEPSPTRRLRRSSVPADDRRTHQRTALEADVSLYSETNFWSGFSEDVSEGGLFVASWELHPIGTQVDVSLELPTGYAIKTRGEVRWHREAAEDGPRPGMGIRFLALADADLRAIQTFVKHRAPLFWDE